METVDGTNITDEQIRDVHDDAPPEASELRHAAIIALAGVPVKRGRRIVRRDKSGPEWTAARTRCAAVWNAREGGVK
jgi:hypothetical protein